MDNLTVIWIHALIRLFKLCRDSADFWSAERGVIRIPKWDSNTRIPKWDSNTRIPEIGILQTHSDFRVSSHCYNTYDG